MKFPCPYCAAECERDERGLRHGYPECEFSERVDEKAFLSVCDIDQTPDSRKEAAQR